MPLMPLPNELAVMVARPNLAVVATVRADGSPHTAATWYDWEDGRVLLNLDESRARLRHIRGDPRVSLTVLDSSSWYRQVTSLGRIVSISRDAALRDIDRLSIRYTGEPFSERAHPRVSAWMQPQTWSSWPLPDRVSAASDAALLDS
jgi:PPOX class probable F420-dependent enzyme